MCYYNGVRVTKEEYIRLKNLELSIRGLHQYMQMGMDGFNYGKSVVVVLGDLGPEAKVMEWGFLPPKVKNRQEELKFRIEYKTLNAKGGELFSSRLYKDAAMKRRGWALSSGIWESQHVDKIGKKGQVLAEKEKIPYRIYLDDPDLPWYPLPIIWQASENEETGEVKDTFSIITTEANELMASIHNSKKRMPVVYDDISMALEWLEPNLKEQRIRELATYQVASEKLKAYRVHKDYKKRLDPTEAYNEPPKLEEPLSNTLF